LPRGRRKREFFYSRETGGTIRIQFALRLMQQIVEANATPQLMEHLCAHGFDGDNWNDDSPICVDLIKQIMPAMQ